MKSVSSLLNTDCEIYSLCMPSCMLKSITNTYLFKNAFPVLHPSAQLFQSAVNTLENTLRSNPNCQNCSNRNTSWRHKDNPWLSSIHYSSWKRGFSQRLLPLPPPLYTISDRSNTPRTNNGVSQ